MARVKKTLYPPKTFSFTLEGEDGEEYVFELSLRTPKNKNLWKAAAALEFAQEELNNLKVEEAEPEDLVARIGALQDIPAVQAMMVCCGKLTANGDEGAPTDEVMSVLYGEQRNLKYDDEECAWGYAWRMCRLPDIWTRVKEGIEKLEEDLEKEEAEATEDVVDPSLDSSSKPSDSPGKTSGISRQTSTSTTKHM